MKGSVRVVLRISCESPEQCRRIAEVMETTVADAVVWTVILCVLLVGVLKLREMRRTA